MPMGSNNPSRDKAAKGIKSAFGGSSDDEDPKPAPVGHTKLDEDQEGSFAEKIARGLKRSR